MKALSETLRVLEHLEIVSIVRQTQSMIVESEATVQAAMKIDTFRNSSLFEFEPTVNG